MSQAGALSTQSSPPAGEITFVTDVDSPAITVGGVINVLGGSTSANTTAGIRTDGSTGGDTFTVELTNRVLGTVTTNDATPTNLAIFALSATPGVYNFDLNIVAFDTTDTLGAGYALFGTVRSDGTNTVLCGVPDKIQNPEAGLPLIQCDLVAGGVGVNQALVVVTGFAATTINWRLVGTYVSVA